MLHCYFEDGMEVEKDYKMAEHAPTSVGDSSFDRKSNKRYHNSDISGEVLFEDFVADEKKDRQGNIS